jgi:hypothetical protein
LIGHPRAGRLLVEAMADPKVQPSPGETPLPMNLSVKRFIPHQKTRPRVWTLRMTVLF